MTIYEKLVRGEEQLSIVGLGYVGLPIAVEFAKKVRVIGFDINQRKIELYRSGIDPTKEIGNVCLGASKVHFTSDERELRNAGFHIVAVPTPINTDKTPDLAPVISASEIVGRNMKRGSVVVYESTVYPGVTENVCIPILEKCSGFKAGLDFKVGYSPERINPGDKVHTLPNIRKVVSGMDDDSLSIIGKVYELIITAGIHPVSSIRAAEAIKVVENSQRDINIAFMNELAVIFDRMGIDTNEVVDGMNTKWNALGFRPGLVGGHCIGVDPYYFIYEAELLGYHSQIILSGRNMNESMADFVTDAIIRQMILAEKNVKKSKIVILGITFKENCPDCRNTKVVDIIHGLKRYGVDPVVCDPYADESEVRQYYGIDLAAVEDVSGADCVVIAVAHDHFRQMGLEKIDSLFAAEEYKDKVIIDIKGILDKKRVDSLGYRYWRL